MVKKQRQWSLARVTKACRSAPAVWVALLDLSESRGSPVITPTRDELSRLSGISRVKTVSKSLSVLEEAGWIGRVHVPIVVGNMRQATLLRINLCRRGRKTPHTATSAVRGAKRPKGRGRKTPQDSLSERGGPYGPAPSLMVGSEPNHPVPYCEPAPITGKKPVEKETHSKGAGS